MSLNPNPDLFNHCLIVLRKSPEYLDTFDDSLDVSESDIRAIWLRTLNYLHITSLNISKNSLPFLPDIFTLRKLNCSNCHLKDLPSFMPVLEYLDCSNNRISSIPNYPNLKTLVCNVNPITCITNCNLTSFSAKNCPIAVVIANPKQHRRSGVVINGEFKWLTPNIYDSYLINWELSKCTVNFKRKFMKKLSKFLFV